MEFWELFTGKKAGGEEAGDEKADVRKAAYDRAMGILMANELLDNGDDDCEG